MKTRPTKIICEKCGSTDIIYHALVRAGTLTILQMDTSHKSAICAQCKHIGVKEVTYFERADTVENYVLDLYAVMGMAQPENHDKIVGYIKDWLESNADPDFWDERDVVEAFRSLIQSFYYRT